jgi:hypothetical protein
LRTAFPECARRAIIVVVTDAEVVSLVEGYRAAFNALDPNAITAFYDRASAIVDMNATGVFPDATATRANVVALTDRYRSLGFVEAHAERVDVDHVSENACEVDVGWSLTLSDGPLRFATRYWLVDRGEGPRIAAVLAYSEKRAMQSRSEQGR